MKIIDYCIPSDSFPPNFEKQVKTLIDEGWQPLGTPTFMNGDGFGFHCFQAMVKYEEPSK